MKPTDLRRVLALASGLFALGLCLRAGAEEPAANDEKSANEPRPATGNDSMPRGPADIIRQAQKRTTPAPAAPEGAAPPAGSKDAKPLPPGHPSVAPAEAAPKGELPAGHPDVAPGQPGGPDGHGPAQADGQAAAPADGEGSKEPPPVGGDPHANAPDAPPLERRGIATAEADPSLPVGTIRVRVVDAKTEQPVGNARIELGTMSRDNSRTTIEGKTSAQGDHRFDKLATGDGQAYRVNVLYDGAKYSSTPFRLPTDQGYDVLIRQLPTTRDSREVVLYVGATSIELRDERLKVVQQARLINIGSKTYVFPEGGQLVKLPEGAKAFQTEEVMTDQKLREDSGGFKVSGSLAPGEVTLTWGFDLPYDTTSVDLDFELPWVTFAYRVLADAAPGMTISVDDMPSPELHDENGRRFWVSEVVKRVGDKPLRHVKIHVRGIPGPGPTRIIALVVALFVLGGGVWLALRQPTAAATPAKVNAEAFEQRKAELVAQAAQLKTDRAREEIGPEFYAEQIANLEEQLAAVLFEQSQLAGKTKAKPA